MRSHSRSICRRADLRVDMGRCKPFIDRFSSNGFGFDRSLRFEKSS